MKRSFKTATIPLTRNNCNLSHVALGKTAYCKYSDFGTGITISVTVIWESGNEHWISEKHLQHSSAYPL